ncbi:MAG: hypothetical protein R3F60_05385 [bacterium]
MLNLYLAARNGGALDLDAALAFLLAEGFVAPPSAEGDHPPGPGVARLFDENAHDELLPAELTFGGLRAVDRGRPTFLPEEQPVDRFKTPRCTLCGDDIDLDDLDRALAEIAFRPVGRFGYICPSCRTDLAVGDIDFGQPTVVARQWLYLESVGTSRLSPRVVDALGKAAGAPLVVVPEVPEDDVDEWVPVRQQRRRPGKWKR